MRSTPTEKIIASLLTLALALLTPALAFAHPDDRGPPEASRVSSKMRVFNFNSERFSVQAGPDYQRQTEGNDVEMPRPAGL